VESYSSSFFGLFDSDFNGNFATFNLFAIHLSNGFLQHLLERKSNEAETTTLWSLRSWQKRVRTQRRVPSGT
jgi:hypothetical protein